MLESSRGPGVIDRRQDRCNSIYSVPSSLENLSVRHGPDHCRRFTLVVTVAIVLVMPGCGYCVIIGTAALASSARVLLCLRVVGLCDLASGGDTELVFVAGVD